MLYSLLMADEIICINSENAVSDILRSWGFEDYIEEFKSNFLKKYSFNCSNNFKFLDKELDYECLINLGEEDLKVIFPDEKLGRRIKFRLRLQEFKKSNVILYYIVYT